MPIPAFKSTHLEALSRAAVDAVGHRDLGPIFTELGIQERGGIPRWERILLALAARQEQDRCGNNVGSFLEAVMDPARFAGRAEEYDNVLVKLNEILAFSGLQLTTAGRLKAVEKASTLSEAQQRASHLRHELLTRKVHPDVLAFCRAELLQDNYFHAVLEATKSVAEKIRKRSESGLDGSELADKAFGGAQPLLALSSLRTETEKVEQRGFVNLLKGFFGTFRNPTAHAAKISWPIVEVDALDLLTLASYLHRRVDGAHRTPWGP
jgi:uncharacterized protein (TIGR02391 family)